MDHQFQMMMQNSNLTILIMNELHRNPERLTQPNTIALVYSNRFIPFPPAAFCLRNRPSVVAFIFF